MGPFAWLCSALCVFFQADLPVLKYLLIFPAFIPGQFSVALCYFCSFPVFWVSHLLRIMPPKPANKKGPKLDSSVPASRVPISQSSQVPSSQSSQVSHSVVRESVYCVCASSSDSGHMVACESCSRWSHSQCVGLSPSCAASYPYVCPFCVCSLVTGLSDMRSEVAVLRDRVISVETTLSDLSVPSIASEVQRINDSLVQLSSKLESHFSAVTSAHAQVDTSTSQSMPVSPQLSGSSVKSSSSDRRYNVHVSGIPEQIHGTSRRARTHADYQSVSSVFKNMSSDLQHQCLIRDCRRLGKYKPDSSSPRPLLVTMNSTADVSFILSHCRSLPSSVSIRPDLTPSQRKARGILLRERRNRIVAGIQSDCIKIRGSKLFVSGTLSGSVVGDAFVPAAFNDAPAALNDASVAVSDSAPPVSPPPGSPA